MIVWKSKVVNWIYICTYCLNCSPWFQFSLVLQFAEKFEAWHWFATRVTSVLRLRSSVLNITSLNGIGLCSENVFFGFCVIKPWCTGTTSKGDARVCCRCLKTCSIKNLQVCALVHKKLQLFTERFSACFVVSCMPSHARAHTHSVERSARRRQRRP